jgi:hypothetical protein
MRRIAVAVLLLVVRAGCASAPSRIVGPSVAPASSTVSSAPASCEQVAFAGAAVLDALWAFQSSGEGIDNRGPAYDALGAAQMAWVQMDKPGGCQSVVDAYVKVRDAYAANGGNPSPENQARIAAARAEWDRLTG